MDKSIFRITLIAMLISGCSDDDKDIVQSLNQNPENFTVQAIEITNNSSLLTWDAVTDPDGDTVTYTVFLEENQVASQLTAIQFLLEDLSEHTTYSGKVVASDGNAGSSESNFSFSTTTSSTNEIGIAWERSFGGSRIDIANSIQLTSDGGYIVVGTSPSDDGDVGGNNDADGYIGGDIWVVKLNSSGDLM
ncbi:fibronectin type III domain-containing protein [Aquimarina litoralis]|uniref:fibronectin type III domain-containing protein n=1 Tax=Aquimarina litoralis TaxID=584605 RepID=UPI001C58906F|nr:fibronectin type III domain-containing protein [Aquimarina litoralis]